MGDSADFGRGIGCEVEFMIYQWGGRRETEEPRVGASAKGYDLFCDGGGL